MNMRSFIIIVAIIAAILAITTFVFISILLKEGEPGKADLPAPTEEVVLIREGPTTEYAIPVNAIPTLKDIEENIKKTNEKQKTFEEMNAVVEVERMKRRTRRESYRQEEPKAETTEAKPKGTTVVIPERKEVVFPTKEEEERMKSQGIMAY